MTTPGEIAEAENYAYERYLERLSEEEVWIEEGSVPKGSTLYRTHHRGGVISEFLPAIKGRTYYIVHERCDNLFHSTTPFAKREEAELFVSIRNRISPVGGQP